MLLLSYFNLKNQVLYVSIIIDDCCFKMVAFGFKKLSKIKFLKVSISIDENDFIMVV